jgi:integrase
MRSMIRLVLIPLRNWLNHQRRNCSRSGPRTRRKLLREFTTIRVDESFDRLGKVGRCKNAAAYRTVLLTDREGKQAMRLLKSFVADRFQNSTAFVFASRRQTPLQESQVLREGLHPTLEALGFPRAGMHTFRRGCNRRWELAGINPAVLRQQMGHTSSAMTALYTGRIPLEQVRAAFSNKMENMENEEAA